MQKVIEPDGQWGGVHVLGDRLVCRGRGCGNLASFGPLPVRPPKCRHATHTRLIAELIACENEARAVVGGMLATMEQRRKGMEHHATRKKPKSRSATHRAADRRRRPDVQG